MNRRLFLQGFSVGTVAALGVASRSAPAATGTPQLLNVSGATLIALQSAVNYGSTSLGAYYRYGSAPLPQQVKITYKIGNVTYTDLTRVGAGQCSDFIKGVTYSSSLASSWKPLQPVVVNGKIANIISGCVLATFTNGKYDSQHCLVYLRTTSATQVDVADQNWLTGKDVAKVVGQHKLTIGGAGLTNLSLYSVVGI